MLPKRFSFSSLLQTGLVALIGCAMPAGCAPASSSPAASVNSQAYASQSARQEVAQLEKARALDATELRDLTISVNRRGDLLSHQAAADQAIRDLQHGFPVDPDRMTYALEVPPSHLTAAQRTAYIEQLRNAIQEDDKREQGVVSFATSVFNADPNAPSEFGDQELFAMKQMKELEEGGHVSWDELQQALYVPPNPL